MKQESLTPFNCLEDIFFIHLQNANQKYISIRQEYEMLIAKMRGEGIAWKDRQSFLINQAKKCGLHRMTEYAGPGKMRHKNFGELKRDKPRWFVMLLKFIEYGDRRYLDYEIPVIKHVEKREQSNHVPKEGRGAGNATKRKANPKGVNKGKTLEQIEKGSKDHSSTTHLEEAAGINLNITAPVEQTLSLLQVQTVILQNLDVLGRIAKAKGAIDEFNALMIKIGAEDEVIVMDSITSPVAYSEVAVQ